MGPVPIYQLPLLRQRSQDVVPIQRFLDLQHPPLLPHCLTVQSAYYPLCLPPSSALPHPPAPIGRPGVPVPSLRGPREEPKLLSSQTSRLWIQLSKKLESLERLSGREFPPTNPRNQLSRSLEQTPTTTSRNRLLKSLDQIRH